MIDSQPLVMRVSSHEARARKMSRETSARRPSILRPDCSTSVSRLKRFLSANIGYPYYSPQYVREFIARPDTDPAELNEYAATHANWIKWVRLSLMVTVLVYYVRAITMPLILMQMMDLNQQEANIKWLSSDIYRFGCLLSNCTKLSPSASREKDEVYLSANLIELPLYRICHPFLSSIHDSTQYMGFAGLMIASVQGFCALMSGFVTPLSSILSPTGNLLLMFSVAPNVTRRVVEELARSLQEKLRESFQNDVTNFMLYRRAKLSQKTQTHFQPHKVDYRSFQSNGNFAFQLPEGQVQLDFSRATVPSSAHENYLINCDHIAQVGRSKFDNEFSIDCISVMRSSWWLERSARFIRKIEVFGSINVAGLILAFYYLGDSSMRARQAVVDEMAVNIRPLNCSFWLEFENAPNLLEPKRSFELSKLELKISPLVDIALILNFAWPALCGQYILITYVATSSELMCWLSELKFELSVGVELLRQLRSRTKWEDQHHSGQAGRGRTLARSSRLGRSGLVESLVLGPESPCSFSMEKLRTAFKQLAGSSVGLTVGDRAGKHLVSAVARQQFAERMIEEDSLTLESAVELQEKLYISLRIFIEHIGHISPSIILIMITTNISNLGIVLTCIWYIKFIKDFVELPAVILLITWIVANFLILLASNFHAKAKGLQPLIWSLLSVTDDCRNIQMSHLRNLWLKQVQVLDMSNGLALAAYNLRVTHVSIIQMIAITATLFAVALRS